MISTERTLVPEKAGHEDQTLRPEAMMPQMTEDIQVSVEGTMRTDGMAVQDEQTMEDSFILKGVTYRKVSVLSDNSGEAQVFLVENEGDNFVLKIYYPNFDVKKKILQVIYNFGFEMIVKIYDYGKTYVGGKHRYYELMEYLGGGTLSEYRLNGDIDKFRRIALQGAAALAYCHQSNILHKDVKPSNFFFRDKEHTELVLGDFGISSMLDKDDL